MHIIMRVCVCLCVCLFESPLLVLATLTATSIWASRNTSDKMRLFDGKFNITRGCCSHMTLTNEFLHVYYGAGHPWLQECDWRGTTSCTLPNAYDPTWAQEQKAFNSKQEAEKTKTYWKKIFKKRKIPQMKHKRSVFSGFNETTELCEPRNSWQCSPNLKLCEIHPP